MSKSNSIANWHKINKKNGSNIFVFFCLLLSCLECIELQVNSDKVIFQQIAVL